MAHDPRVQAWFEALEVEVHNMEDLFHTLDDGDGNVNQEEFLKSITSMKGTASGLYAID